jgi:outer membrane lipoprotein SlyB
MTGNHVRGICQRCGVERPLNSLRKEWNGLKVCDDCFDHRHPQDFVRGVPDQQAVRDPAPEPEDVFVDTNEVSPTGTAVSVHFTASEVKTADASSFTFSSVDFGTAFPSRKIIVGIAHRENVAVTISSLTIGGVAASVISGTATTFTAGGLSAIAFYQAAVPTEETGDIVVTLSGSALRCSIGVWAATKASTVVDTGTATSDPAADTLTVVDRGWVIGYAFQTHNATGVTATWSGLAEDFDGQVEGNTTHTGANARISSNASLLMSCDWSSTPATGGAATFVSFGP